MGKIWENPYAIDSLDINHSAVILLSLPWQNGKNTSSELIKHIQKLCTKETRQTTPVDEPLESALLPAQTEKKVVLQKGGEKAENPTF